MPNHKLSEWLSPHSQFEVRWARLPGKMETLSVSSRKSVGFSTDTDRWVTGLSYRHSMSLLWWKSTRSYVGCRTQTRTDPEFLSLRGTFLTSEYSSITRRCPDPRHNYVTVSKKGIQRNTGTVFVDSRDVGTYFYWSILLLLFPLPFLYLLPS